jgi:hypothetical protein
MESEGERRGVSPAERPVDDREGDETLLERPHGGGRMEGERGIFWPPTLGTWPPGALPRPPRVRADADAGRRA